MRQQYPCGAELAAQLLEAAADQGCGCGMSMTRHPSSEASLATLDPGTNQPADLLALAAGGLLEVVASVPSWSSQSAAATVGQGAEKLAQAC